MSTTRRVSRLARSPLTTAARTVGHARLPAVTLVAWSPLRATYCAACSTLVPARTEMALSSRDSDLTDAMTVAYCTAACRAARVSA